MPYWFSRSSVKFQGDKAKKIVDFDPNWAFPDCNSSLKLPMVLRWCTKFEVAWKRCRILFQDHLSNFKVARDKKIVDFYPNWGFPDWNSSLNSLMEMMHKVWCSIEEVPYYFSRSSNKFQGHTGWKIDDLNPIWVRLLVPSQLSNPSDLPHWYQI